MKILPVEAAGHPARTRRAGDEECVWRRSHGLGHEMREMKRKTRRAWRKLCAVCYQFLA